MTHSPEAQTLTLNTAPPRLVIVPDLSQLLSDGWTEDVVATIMEARGASTVAKVVIATPELAFSELFTDRFYSAFKKWSFSARTGLSVSAKRHDDLGLYEIGGSFMQHASVCIATREFFNFHEGNRHEAWTQLISDETGLDPSMRESALHFITSEDSTVLFPGAPSNPDMYPFREFCVVEFIGGRIRYRAFEAGSYGAAR